ncbi:hypothetical protein D3C80_1236500 [compost metagenome]
MARLIASTVLPASGVGEVIARVRQPFSSMALSTCVRSRSIGPFMLEFLLYATMRWRSRWSARSGTTLVFT